MKIPPEVVAAARESRFEIGLKMKIRGHYLQAISQFDEAIKIVPYHASAWYAKGECMVCLKQYEQCISCFDKALKFDPALREEGFRNAPPGFPKELDNLRRFVESISEDINVRPENSELWHNQGVMMRVLGRNKEALDCFEQVIRVKPDPFEAWLHKGGLLGISGWHKKDRRFPHFVPQQLGEAIKAYDEALKIRVDQCALVNRGLVMIRAGQRKYALDSFDNAISISPDYGEAWVQKGILLVKMKKRKEADKCFERALQLNPEYSTHYGMYIDEWRPGWFDWD